jgi:hypothetical protein
VIRILGGDFVAMRTAAGVEVLMPMAAISSLRTAPSVPPSSGDRVVTTELCLGDVLAELATDRARVRLALLDGRDAVAGELRAVGTDVVTLRSDGEGNPMAYVRIGAIAEVTAG